MAPFATIELHERAAARCFVIDEVQGMDGLVDSTKFRDALLSISVFSVVYFSIDVARGEQTITNTPSEKPKTKFPLSMRLPDPADGDIHY